jgi:hypothetical protein
MRDDMAKVIVERPRMRFPLKNGSAYPRGSLKNDWYPDYEDAPKRESYGHGRYAEKRLNENLQPLVRFLRSNVDRPWNKVRSEIAARISCNSAVQKHVLDHLAHFVAEHVVRRDREVFLAQRFSHGLGDEPLRSRGMRMEFYVDPRSGLLRLAKFTPSPKKKPKREASR